MIFKEEDADLPAKSDERTLYEMLDAVVYYDQGNSILPLAQYVRSRLLPGHPAPPRLEPYLSVLLRVNPGTVEDALLAMLKAYMDEHPDRFMRFEQV
jgi:hypothetical protein